MMHKLAGLLALLLLSGVHAVRAQEAPPVREQKGRGSVSGVVFDSLARRPLAGAAVQLVGTDSNATFSRTAVSDSLGRFLLTDVPIGRYTLGFFHPVLDSVGIESPLQGVSITRAQPVRADLFTPSPARLSTAICGTGGAGNPVADSSALIVGFVRDARDRSPVVSARVAAEWLELTFSTGGVERRVPRLAATTGENGWFALCNVPRDGTVAMRATRGADSTDRVEMLVPAAGFLRRDLYVGRSIPRARVALTPGQAGAAASPPAAPAAPARTGDGRISGRVVTADSGKTVAGAIVAIRDGPVTRANDRGEWVLSGIPTGTRMLEVRAVGFSLSRQPVDVFAGSAPLTVALSSTKAVLDTVRVRGQLAFDRRMGGFAERRRSYGGGRFLNAEEIARRQPIMLSDAFRTIPGVEVAGDAIRLRGTSLEKCTPEFYLNGAYIGVLDAVDLDAIAKPKDVLGIEIYPAGTEPPQFNRGMGADNCGSVLIWTR